MNKQVNSDLTVLVNWLRANKISLNTKKTELVLFKTKNKKINKNLNFRISDQKITPVKHIKYLGVKIDENLSFQPHLCDLEQKLSHSNGLLAKVRHYVSFETLLNIYHAIFGSHIRYACQIWGQNINQCNKIISLQNKALRIINFQPPRTNCDVLYYFSNILKIQDQITALNCLLVSDQLNKRLPVSFNNTFNLARNDRYGLRSATLNNLTIPHNRTQRYGHFSISYQCILSWNGLSPDLKALGIKDRSNFANKIKLNMHSKYI